MQCSVLTSEHKLPIQRSIVHINNQSPWTQISVTSQCKFIQNKYTLRRQTHNSPAKSLINTACDFITSTVHSPILSAAGTNMSYAQPSPGTIIKNQAFPGKSIACEWSIRMVGLLQVCLGIFRIVEGSPEALIHKLGFFWGWTGLLCWVSSHGSNSVAAAAATNQDQRCGTKPNLSV